LIEAALWFVASTQKLRLRNRYAHEYHSTETVDRALNCIFLIASIEPPSKLGFENWKKSIANT
jgi:hypothetical protein